MIEGRANELRDLQVFRTVLSYCAFIIALPVVTFFGSKALVFDRLLGLDDVPSNVYSAISAVVVLHVALGLYIARAYSEADRPRADPAKLD